MEGWEPDTLEQLERALAAGVLEEGTDVEFKALVATGDKASKEWARDVAAMAVLGGRIYIGVAETDGPPVVTPVPLSDLAERLEQIVGARVRPPLVITSRQLPGADGDGVLIVRVPLSPSAPHMVDGRYWRRLDKTKAQMSDVEVRDMLARQATAADLAAPLLDELVAASEDDGTGSVYFAAVPVHGRPEMLHEAAEAAPADWPLQAVGFHGRRPRRWSPMLASAHQVRMTGQGTLVHSGGTPIKVMVQFGDDGTIWAVNRRGAQDDEQGVRRIIPALPPGTVLEALLAVRYAARVMNYTGAWDLGVLIDKLQGARPTTEDFSYDFSGHYIGEEHRQTLRATAEEIDRAPHRLMTRLVGRFMRALGTVDQVNFREFLPSDAAET